LQKFNRGPKKINSNTGHLENLRMIQKQPFTFRTCPQLVRANWAGCQKSIRHGEMTMAKNIRDAVRAICLSLPERHEVSSRGNPNFRVKKPSPSS